MKKGNFKQVKILCPDGSARVFDSFVDAEKALGFKSGCLKHTVRGSDEGIKKVKYLVERV